MRKETWTVVALAFLVLILNIVVTKALQEPRYEGESFDYWFAESSSPEEEIRANAYRALGALHSLDHPRALSTLMMRLAHESSPVACAEGIRVLGALGSDNPRAIPIMVSTAERVKSPAVDKEALLALGRLRTSDSQAMPFVAAKLRDESTRKQALETVRLLRTNAAPVLPTLVELSTSPIAKAADLQELLEAFLYVRPEGAESAELSKVVDAILSHPETNRHVVLVSAVKVSYYLEHSSVPETICKKLSAHLADPEKRQYALDLLIRLESSASYAVSRTHDLLVELVDSEGEDLQKDLLRKCVVVIYNGSSWRDTRTANALTLRLDRSKPLAVRKRAVYCLSGLGSMSRAAFTALEGMRAEEGLDPGLAALLEEAVRNIGGRQ